MSVKVANLRTRSAFAETKSFGKFGEFELLEYDLEYTVDPNHRSNANIVDIALAPTGDNGEVRFKGFARLIAPKTTAPACLLIDVPNRGRPTAFSFNRPNPAELQTTTTPVGDGFLFKRGFAVLSVGWQFDAEGLSLAVPDAKQDNAPIKGDAICQMQPNRNTDSLMVGQGGVFTYEPTGEGRLYQRANSNLPYIEVPTDEWQFGRKRQGSIEPTNRFITKQGGFEKGAIYTLVYETEGAPLVGLGMLAIRDATAWFKHEFPWTHGSPRFAIGYGASQTGRFLRHFLYENLNSDENDRQVFDGILPHIAGGQRGDFNHRFAQPGSMGVPAAGQRFPFSMRETFDQYGESREGLVSQSNTQPKVISTNTSWEYWRGDASLIHVSTSGEEDITPLSNERIYMFAGTHHINGVLPFTDKFALTGEALPYHLNTISYTPLLRAILAILLDWIRDGIEPPTSQYPKLSDRSLVTRQHVLDKFAQSSHFSHVPVGENLPSLWLTDLGPLIDEGICQHPAKLVQRYPSLVSDIGECFNEVAGIRLPEISIPIGIHTGWNPRHPDHGAPDQTATFAGLSKFNVEGTVPESEAECRIQVEQATDELISSRFVLAEDRQLVIDNAMKRFALSEL